MGNIIYLDQLRRINHYEDFFSALADDIWNMGPGVLSLAQKDLDIKNDSSFHIDLIHNPSGSHVLIQSAGSEYFTVMIISKTKGKQLLHVLYPFNREISRENVQTAMKLINRYFQEN